MNISVYLGSSPACLAEYNQLAYDLGRAIAEAGHTLVYGGANVGTMKFLAEGAQSAGGDVIGVFPRGFAGTVEVKGMEIMRPGLTEMVMTEDFAERKKVMEQRSDCCIILPGSFGTLDELFTYACNRSIGKHAKQIYVLDHNGYYSPLRQLFANMDAAGFLKPSTVGIVTFCDCIEDILARLK